MSTDYRILNIDVSEDELFDGRLERFGIVEHLKPAGQEGSARWLTDGNNFLAVWGSEKAVSFTRYFPNGWPACILDAIAEAFDADIVSEHDCRYWGFATEEEMDAWHEKHANEDRDRFYDDVIKYVSGRPNDIGPGTIGEIQATIAKTLVEERPELALPAHKAELMSAIDTIYERDHTVKIRLDEKDMAFVKMLATNEGNLPQS